MLWHSPETSACVCGYVAVDQKQSISGYIIIRQDAEYFYGK